MTSNGELETAGLFIKKSFIVGKRLNTPKNTEVYQ